MKALRVTVLSLLAVVLLGATAFGAGLAVRKLDDRRADAPRAVEHSQTPTHSSAPTPDPTVEPEPEPEFRLARGSTGEQIRELQHRLFQLDWFPEATTGTYDAETVVAVEGFQGKRNLPTTGVVDQRTWDRLVSMTEKPTHDQMFNILKPGPAILATGASGDGVRDLQARLKQIQWFSGDVTGSYGSDTTEAVKGFQAKRAIPVTGEVDQRTLDRLHAMTSTPTHEELHNIQPEPVAGGALDPRCLTGRVLCIDKSSSTLRWVVSGKVVKTMDARFGSTLRNTPTREGVFSVYMKSRDHVSSLYDSSMPFAMFFDGGQAVHYSSDFAATGYNGASHGCVNIRDYNGIAWLFDQVQIGDKVVVYWS